MLIGVPREVRHGETRVAATPKTVGQLLALGYLKPDGLLDIVAGRLRGETVDHAAAASDEP